jgi:hypothetical protein
MSAIAHALQCERGTLKIAHRVGKPRPESNHLPTHSGMKQNDSAFVRSSGDCLGSGICQAMLDTSFQQSNFLFATTATGFMMPFAGPFRM